MHTSRWVQNLLHHKTSVIDGRININKLIDIEFEEISIGLGRREILQICVGELMFEMDCSQIFAILKHSNNSFPTTFSSIIDHKNEVEDILCDRGINLLQNYRIDTVPEIEIINLCLFGCLPSIYIGWRNNTIKYVMDTWLNLKHGIPRDL